MIVLFHVRAIPNLQEPDALGMIRWHFGLAVNLFFVLSAFSLAHSTRVEDLPGYFIKRFFRIAPLFYVALIFYQTIFGAKPVLVTLANATFIFNLIPGLEQSGVWAGWTIGVEMLFYLTLPVLLILCKTVRASLVLTLIAILVSWVGRALLEQSSLPKFYSHAALVSNYAYFCMGLLAYRLFQNQTVKVGRIGLISLAIVAAGLVVPGSVVLAPGRPDSLVFGLGFAGICLWQAARPSWLMRLQIMQFLGERSYSLYVLHPLVIFCLTPLYPSVYATFGGSPWSYVACAAMTLFMLSIVADATYRLIEAPSIRFGRILIERMRNSKSPKETPPLPHERTTLSVPPRLVENPTL